MARKTVKELTRDEAFALADEIARDIVANRALVAERDQHVQDVQDKYNPLIEANDKSIDAKIALVAVYAKAHRGELFGDKKSADTPLAVLSFRYGTPTLKTLSAKDSWDDITKLGDVIPAVLGRERLQRRGAVPEGQDGERRVGALLVAEQLASMRLRVDRDERDLGVDRLVVRLDERVVLVLHVLDVLVALCDERTVCDDVAGYFVREGERLVPRQLLHCFPCHVVFSFLVVSSRTSASRAS